MKRSPLKRKKALKRGGKLSPMSAKRARDSSTYFRLREEFLSQNPVCQVCNKRKATDVHHKKLRKGKNYLDVSTFMAVCRYPCHRWIHNNPAEAEAKGYLDPDRFR